MMKTMKSIVILSHGNRIPLRLFESIDFYERIKAISREFESVTIIRNAIGKKEIKVERDPEHKKIKLVTITGNFIEKQVISSIIISKIEPSVIIADTLSDIHVAILHIIFSKSKLVIFIRGYDRFIISNLVKQRYGKVMSSISNLLLLLRDGFAIHKSNVVITVTQPLLEFAKNNLFRSKTTKMICVERSFDYCKNISENSIEKANKIVLNIQKKHGTKMNLISIVSNLYEGKNVDIAIKAFACAKKQIENAVLFIIGSGPYSNFLMQLAKSLGLGEYVYFLGRIPRDVVLALHKKMDMMIYPSISEGSARAVREALAMGCPVVSYNFKGSIQLGLNHGCILINNLDPQSFAEAIIEILSNSNLRELLEIEGKRMMKPNVNRSNQNRISMIIKIIKSVSAKT